MAMTMKKGRSIPGSRLSLFLLLLMAAFASTSSATDGDESVIVAGTAIAVKKLRTRGPTGCQDAEEREAVRDVLTRVLDELDQLKSRVRSLEEGNGRLYRDPSPRDPPPQPERRTLQAAPRTVSLTQFNQFKRSVTAQLTTLNQSLAALSDALTGAAARLDTTAQGLSSLEARLACVDASSDGNELVFSGCNVNIRNGLNRTESTNGRGNLVVGYNENESDVGVLRSRDGSHMVVVGPNHGWRGFGGIVSGESHLQESGYASIVGGRQMRRCSGTDTCPLLRVFNVFPFLPVFLSHRPTKRSDGSGGGGDWRDRQRRGWRRGGCRRRPVQSGRRHRGNVGLGAVEPRPWEPRTCSGREGQHGGELRDRPNSSPGLGLGGAGWRVQRSQKFRQHDHDGRRYVPIRRSHLVQATSRSFAHRTPRTTTSRAADRPTFSPTLLLVWTSPGFRNAIPFGSSNSASNLVQVGGADHTGTGLVTHDVSVSGTRFPG